MIGMGRYRITVAPTYVPVPRAGCCGHFWILASLLPLGSIASGSHRASQEMGISSQLHDASLKIGFVLDVLIRLLW